MLSTCADQCTTSSIHRGASSLGSKGLIEIHEAIGGNGFFCIPQPDSEHVNITISTTDLSNCFTPNCSPTSVLQVYQSKRGSPRYLDFLPKKDCLGTTTLDKQQYRKFRLQQYRQKKYRKSISPKVRYVERQKMAQRRFRQQGKFVSKQVQLEMSANAETSNQMEMEQYNNNNNNNINDENILELSFNWSNCSDQYEETGMSFYDHCMASPFLDVNVFYDPYWFSSPENMTWEIESFGYWNKT
ncbi:hypothetical protein GAYE_SCF12G3334 [Galdieria yellowstonensis]|uniref:CCT domain-containing protein n=1 Tax=Galdieria yellowstonensis TaxID=3028027 RepID=A0AAV9IE12_9RHOD|nr:hypothetical protein GAYE_SCF12G3334 [Galdieria yellowstonensis]